MGFRFRLRLKPGLRRGSAGVVGGAAGKGLHQFAPLTLRRDDDFQRLKKLMGNWVKLGVGWVAPLASDSRFEIDWLHQYV